VVDEVVVEAADEGSVVAVGMSVEAVVGAVVDVAPGGWPVAAGEDAAAVADDDRLSRTAPSSSAAFAEATDIRWVSRSHIVADGYPYSAGIARASASCTSAARTPSRTAVTSPSAANAETTQAFDNPDSARRDSAAASAFSCPHTSSKNVSLVHTYDKIRGR
jgi:hypothetical protein